MEGFHEAQNGQWGIRCPSWREPKTWAKQDLDELEEEVMGLDYSPQKAFVMDQARTIWELGIARNQTVSWVIRTRRPSVVVLLAMCEWADVEIRRVISGRLEEEDFTRLTSVCWKVAPAPIKVCDARNPGSFLKSVPLLVSEAEASYVVCDWELEGEELSTAKQWSLESGMTFLCQAPWSI
jgi:hypothetical protein